MTAIHSHAATGIRVILAFGGELVEHMQLDSGAMRRWGGAVI